MVICSSRSAVAGPPGSSRQTSRAVALAALFALAGGAVRAVAEGAPEPSTNVMGSYSQAVPIAVPPFRGLQPSLVLAYNSDGGNGFAGAGWRLAGFTRISRVSDALGTPRFEASDVYLLGGQELLPCQTGTVTPSCDSGGTHTTKIESVLRIALDSEGDIWTVTATDGTRTEFAPLVGTESGTIAWGKSATTDTLGNTVSYVWACIGGDCFPASVSYGGYAITFYREPRPDVATFATGSPSRLGRSAYRLKSVLVALEGSPIRAYELTYSISAATGRSLLASVRQYGMDVIIDGVGNITGGSALPAQTFTYASDPAAGTLAPWPSAN